MKLSLRPIIPVIYRPCLKRVMERPLGLPL